MKYCKRGLLHWVSTVSEDQNDSFVIQCFLKFQSRSQGHPMQKCISFGQRGFMSYQFFCVLCYHFSSGKFICFKYQRLLLWLLQSLSFQIV